MIIQQPFDMSFKIPNTNAIDELWCVYECFVNDYPYYVMWCKLSEVFQLSLARQNSEWHKLFGNGSPMLIRIHVITDNADEAMKLGILRRKEYDPEPRCNLHGWNMKNAARPLMCVETGTSYTTQSEAAIAMKLNQGNLSRHLKGQLKSCGGFTFKYI